MKLAVYVMKRYPRTNTIKFTILHNKLYKLDNTVNKYSYKEILRQTHIRQSIICIITYFLIISLAFPISNLIEQIIISENELISYRALAISATFYYITHCCYDESLRFTVTSRRTNINLPDWIYCRTQL